MKRTILFIITLITAMIISAQALSEIGSWEYGPTEAVAVKDSTAYISSGSYLWVLDISDESNISLVDEIKLSNYINFIELIGNYLYITKRDSICLIYDAHDSRNIFKAGEVVGDKYNEYRGITHYNDRIYICKYGWYTDEFSINDTVNIQKERWAGRNDQFLQYNDIGISIYDTRGSDEVFTYDLTQSGDLNKVGQQGYNYDLRGMFIRYPYVYLGRGPDGIAIVDITDIASLKTFPDYNTGNFVYDVEQVNDTVMAVANGLEGVQLYDIDDDTVFTLISECPVNGFAYELEVLGDRVYVGARSGGLSIINISDVNNPIVLGNYDGYCEIRGCDVIGNRLYAASGEAGLAIYDITDRTNPQFISKTPGRFVAYDVKVDSIYAYLAEGDSGITIMDISDEDSVFVLGGLTTTHFGISIDECNDVVAFGGYDELTTHNTGLSFIDVSNKTNPVETYMIFDDLDHIFFGYSGDILHAVAMEWPDEYYYLYDLSDPYSPVIIDSIINEIQVSLLILNDSLSVFRAYADTLECYNISNPDSIYKISSFYADVSYYDGIGTFMGNFVCANTISGTYLFDYSDPYNPSFVCSTHVNMLGEELTGDDNYCYESYGEGNIDTKEVVNRGRYGMKIFTYSPAGIDDENEEVKNNISVISTLNAIQIQNNTNTTQIYQITDITGRVIDNITIKQGLNTYTPKQSGIYFVINNSNETIGKAIIIK